MREHTDMPLTVYHGLAAYLPSSEVFTHRLLKALEPTVRQVVLARWVENESRFPAPCIEQLHDRALFDPDEAGAAAARLQRRHRAHVLHTHLGYSAISFVMLKHFLQVPMVVTFGGRDLTARGRSPATHRLYCYIFEAAERLVAVSDDLRGCAVALGCPPDRIVTVHRGVDAGEFPQVDRSGRSGRPVEILMVGRLVEKKGHRYAVEALAALGPGVPDWRLTIAGDGPTGPGVGRSIRLAGLADRVRLLGAVPIERVRQEMAAADVMLHPSVTGTDGDREGIPNAVLEAQAAGLPVVATRHGGIPEAVADGETGLLVPERDAAALAGALRRVIDEAGMRLRLGRAGAERARREFSIERQANAYLAIYRELAERYPRGCEALRRLPAGPPLTALMRAARRESAEEGSVPASELVEGLLPARRGSSWRHRAISRLRRLVPVPLRQPGKRMLSGINRWLYRRVLERTAERDDRAWEAVRRSGIPDPLETGETAS